MGLGCSNNLLTSLDVSNNTVLERLSCEDNQLSSLDVSNNTALSHLFCGQNQITTLDISKNTNLFTLLLNDMPSLSEVCVWWDTPSPPDSIWVETTGSPNVCFETNCNGVCENTRIEEYKKEVLSIFPNPSDDIINIEIENPDYATIEIYNVSGRLVLSKEINLKVEKIDLSGYAKGIYLLKVKQADRVYYGKVVVN